MFIIWDVVCNEASTLTMAHALRHFQKALLLYSTLVIVDLSNGNASYGLRVTNSLSR